MEDQEEEEPKYWTPESEAAKDPEARANKILDSVEKKLAALSEESLRPPIMDPYIATAGTRAHIEVRMISNGFVMSFSRATLEPRTGLPFPVYRPTPEEIFIAGPASAGAALADAMESALLLADCLKKIEEYNKTAPGPFGVNRPV